MPIVFALPAAVAAGRRAFHLYLAPLLCGSGSHPERETGAAMLPGIILACIERGIDRSVDLLAAAARVSRCRGATVATVLRSLSGLDPAAHLWFEGPDGRFCALADWVDTGA